MSDDQPTKPNPPVQMPAQPEPQIQYVYIEKPRKGCVGGCLGRTLILGILLLAFIIFGGIAAAGAIVYNNLSKDIEEGIAKLDAVDERELFETTQIFDRNGELLWEIFGEGNRTNIPIADMPVHLVMATVSVEDDTFYENRGLDYPAIIAALWANVQNPDGRPAGASTITQQIVRHIVFDYDERTAVSYNRKAKEIVLAWIMTQKFTKDEIMELYLNEIYYGNLAYGIEAAAQTYFNKSAADLTLGEATLLTGLPQSPVELDPIKNFEAARERQWLVLSLMYSEGYITQAEAEAAYLEPLDFAVQEVSLVAPHFSVYVREQLEAMYGADAVANGGLRVTTTLDLNYQRLAEGLTQQHVNAIAPEHNLNNAALVSMKPGTGEILAMVGSVDYYNEAIDGHVNVVTSLQQPGSSIKPLTYAAAMEPNAEGESLWTPADVLWDVEVEYGQANGAVYSPVNYDGRFHGPVRFRQALASSFNIPAVLLLQDIGVPAYIDFAEKMGISTWTADSSNYGLSITLGGAEVTPLDMATAYSVFANDGDSVLPMSILRVEKRDGTVLNDFAPVPPQPVLHDGVAFIINDILSDDAARVAAMGSGNPLDLSFTAAAKTGTTNDFRDNWTIGYTPGLVTAVWAGNTDNSEMLNVTGLTGAAPLWGAFMEAVHIDAELMATQAIDGVIPATEFNPPESVEQIPLCAIASVTVGATDCTSGGTEWALKTAPEAATPVPTADTVLWDEIDPAVMRITAVSLPPIPIEALTGQEPDDDAPPPQLFCHFAAGTDSLMLPPDALPQLFVDPPRNAESVKAAHEWAQAHNIAIQPAALCDDELLAAARDPNRVAVYRISEPKDGDVVGGIMPIIGTADFDPAVVQFYKFELGIPKEDGNVDWLTLGETHNTPVVNGVLETLYAEGLPAGEYLLRLIVVKDSNYVGEPHMIQFVVE